MRRNPIHVDKIVVVRFRLKSGDSQFMLRLWRQVLEYFDAFTIGLTATPSKQTIGFFNQNLVMEYGHDRAVAEGVNVGYEVYRIRTKISESGSHVDSGFYVDKRDRLTRDRRWEQLEDDLDYDARELDRAVVSPSQIRTIIRAFRERLFTEIFPGRTEVPKTLIFAKDDSHAEDIVEIVRDEFGKGNEFCKKITYRTTGEQRIGVIPVGYADGFRRAPRHWGEVLVRGQRALIVGRVCMDQTMIDVTAIPDVRQGDEVVLIGQQGEERITAEDVAERLGTINYEVVSEILARVPRIV